MKTTLHGLSIALRLSFGALFVFAGINDFLHLWQPPAPITPSSQRFMQGLVASGFVMPVLGAVYLASGLCLLANRFVALALIMLAAPVVVIVGFHAVTEGHLAAPGVFVLVAQLILSWQQRNTFAVLFRPHGQAMTSADPAPAPVA